MNDSKQVPAGSACCPRCGGLGYVGAGAIGGGERLRLLRELAGLSQEQLAVATGVSRPQIANLEAGRSLIPTKNLRAFAAALGCKAEDLIP